MKQLRIFFLCLVAATLVTACGGDDKDNSTPVEKITLDKDKLTFVAQWKMRPSHFPEGGFTVVKGDGYTLTQLDLEKITSLEMDVTGSSVTSENCELVLDTAENAIKLRIKATEPIEYVKPERRKGMCAAVGWGDVPQQAREACHSRQGEHATTS